MPPLERHALLRPLSREHHDGLLFCWRIRQGLSNGTDPAELKRSGIAFHDHQLLPHFAIEEETLFPILGAGDPDVVRAVAEHRRLTRLFCRTEDPLQELSCIESELAAHIRFEERVLFPRIQAVATEEQLERIERSHGLMNLI